MEQAGADALELNIYSPLANLSRTAAEVKKGVLRAVAEVARKF